jgi:hypothetical protein
MILLLFSVILIMSHLYDDQKLPYYLAVYFVFYDMFDGFYKDDKIFAILRYGLPVALMLLYSYKYNIFKRIELVFIAMISYLFLLWILNPGDVITTTKSVLPVLITLFMIPIGRYLGQKSNVIDEFEKYNRLLLVSIPLYIVFANKIGIEGFYSDAFSTGYLITSRLYIIPIVVFLAIHYSLTNTKRSWWIQGLDVSFVLINICMLLLSTRRTTLLMLVAAILIYTLFNKRLFLKMLTLLFVLVAVLIVSFPLYQDRLMGQLEKRERIESLDTYEEEGRYLETFYLINYHKKKGDLAEVLFGINLFDTYSFGTRYFGRDRPIHSDINMIFFGTGVVGIILFILFFSHYFLKGNYRISEHNRILFYPLLANFLIVLIPGRFIGTLTFPPLLMLLLAALKYEQQLEIPEVTVEERLAISGC